METVGYSQLGDVADAAVHHIPASSHHEAHALCPLEDFRGGLDEIFRSLLESDSSEEGDDLVAHSPLDLQVLPAAEVHGVVDGHDLLRVNAVLVDDDVPREVADGDHLVGGHHSPLLDVIDTAVDLILGSTVERRGVHVDNQWLAGQFLGRDSGQIGQPVVGVDDVELILVLHSYRAADHRIVGDLLHKIGAVTS